MYGFLAYRVRHVMTTKPIGVIPDTTLEQAGGIFEDHDFNALPVLDERGELVGVLTKLDFLVAFAFGTTTVLPPYEEITQRPVSSVMTRKPVTVTPETPLTRVLETMVFTRYKSFPVLDDRRVVGIVAREDVMRALRCAAAGEVPEG